MTATATFWDGIAEQYAAKPVENPDAFDRKVELTRSRIRPGDRVLNIGCGTGSLSLRLASTGAELHGLDISGEMVRIARDKARDQGVDNVRFHVGPFDDTFTTFEPESLDGVCAFSILHLLQDRPAALARIHDLLKPGGFFVSSTVCLGESWIPYALMLTPMRWFGKAPPVWIVSKQQLEQEIRQAGFVDLQQPDVGAGFTVGFAVADKRR